MVTRTRGPTSCTASLSTAPTAAAWRASQRRGKPCCRAANSVATALHHTLSLAACFLVVLLPTCVEIRSRRVKAKLYRLI